MPLAKFGFKFSGGVYLLLGQQIRSSDSARKAVPNTKENKF
jgi:hypothetical protein